MIIRSEQIAKHLLQLQHKQKMQPTVLNSNHSITQRLPCQRKTFARIETKALGFACDNALVVCGYDHSKR